jgi:hypothetical protein
MLLSDPFEALFNLQRALDAFRQSDWLEQSTTGTGAYPPSMLSVRATTS